MNICVHLWLKEPRLAKFSSLDVVNLFFQNLDRQRAVLEHNVVEVALVEFFSELLLRAQALLDRINSALLG